jgi:predicted regulator of Ras-like GTPase activity (Roadblock/LC7/MglB family)
MSRHQSALEALTAIAGVHGAMLATRDDGIVVAESLMEGVESGALAALASSLARRLASAAEAAHAGAAGFLHLQATNGTLFVAPAGPELLLVVIADKGVNVGRTRLEMSRVVEVGT